MPFPEFYEPFAQIIKLEERAGGDPQLIADWSAVWQVQAGDQHLKQKFGTEPVTCGI